MTIKELNIKYSELLKIDLFSHADDAVNGLQVGSYNTEIKSVAFAVDAALEAFKRAHDLGANAIVVHHGLFWNKGERITGAMHEKIAFLIQNKMALFAYHLPLDAHSELGNNIGLCRALKLENLSPFGIYHGIPIGFSGSFKDEIQFDDALKRVLPNGDMPLALFPFGKKNIKTCAVISGGAPFELSEAIEKDIDLYITGDASHSVYHTAFESKINMISAGHYETETFGVKALSEYTARNFGLPTQFINLPTGL